MIGVLEAGSGAKRSVFDLRAVTYDSGRCQAGIQTMKKKHVCVEPKIGVPPKWMVSLSKWMICGYPYF